MLTSCFFGANTPQGFRSEADSLQADPVIRRLVILKGGPGCGKSTLMKTLAREAERMGLKVRRIFCSSDPDSLDGLVVPETGLAVADGTAPHVLEPELCACGANYLNLGVYYHDAAALGMARTLRAEQAAYQACYGPAYACLSGAAGAEYIPFSFPEQHTSFPQYEYLGADLPSKMYHLSQDLSQLHFHQ